MIIGLVGFAGSGKGTVGDLLVDKYKFYKLAFADSVKDATAAIFGWPRHLLEGDTDESRAFREKKDEFWSAKLGYDLTPRLALQKVGTEAGRDVFGDNLWITSTERRMIELDNVVVTDVRFPNEIKFIQKMGGFVIRVIRGPEPEWYDTAVLTNTVPEDREWIYYDRGELMENKFPNIHPSEWKWIGHPMDYMLWNNGNKGELEANVSYMLTTFQGPGRVQKIA